ncbi:MAG: hypothetical protein ACT4RN_02690, partial [Pseudonocardia sp.]
MPHPLAGPGICWDEARRRAHAAGVPARPEAMTAAAALGTVLAAPMRAAVALPATDRSAMDGYAVRGEPPWQVVGRVPAGAPGPADLADGQAYAVATGAALP